jgi:hypothetical protein
LHPDGFDSDECFFVLLKIAHSKVGDRLIVIIKELPVIQCYNCGEYLIEDQVMARVESILSVIDSRTEFEIVRYAA